MVLIRNQVYGFPVPWVRIPPSPPVTKKSPLQGAFFVTGRYVEFEPMGSTKRASILDARTK